MDRIKQLSTLLEVEISNLQLPQQPRNLYDPIIYILEAGGKRIRPIMVLAAALAYGGEIEKSIKAALALEVFHNFTLLHDDIMDNADVRRARDTVHKKWNENVAILSGDAMVIHSYKLLADVNCQRFTELFSTFNRLAALVCEGQQMDMDFESSDNVTIEQYIEMITLKTSALIAGALKIGAIIGDASEESCEKIYEFGIDLGIAFQLQDDLLDTYGDQSLFGKRIGGDILEGKKTFLLLSALNSANDEVKSKLYKTLNDTTMADEDKIERVRSTYDMLGVREIAQLKIDHYIASAFDILNELEVNDSGRELLSEIANRLINRKS